jgi:hypothetical protein
MQFIDIKENYKTSLRTFAQIAFGKFFYPQNVIRHGGMEVHLNKS